MQGVRYDKEDSWIKHVIMSFWLVQNLSEEGFPTSPVRNKLSNGASGNSSSKGYMIIPEAVLRGILLIKIKNRRKKHKNNRR
ncbi:MAG: hypothetical protein QMC83_08915 [Thermodesulfovibrionales bacterium]|nr:hypothetical protein [Thermodesulfovibrionales bacterium]